MVDVDGTTVAKRVFDGSRNQTVTYKLDAVSEINKFSIYHSNNDLRMTSRYQVSLAVNEEDLFTDKAATYDIYKADMNNYDIVTLDEPVTAKFFAVRVLCGVHPTIEGTGNTGSNYARVNYMAIQGTSLACGDDAHAFEDVIVTEADCLNVGSKYSVCTVCGFETEAVEIPALGLTEGKHCSVCGEVLVAQETVDALGHTPEVVPGYAADCTNPGLTEGSK